MQVNRLVPNLLLQLQNSNVPKVEKHIELAE